MGFSTRPGLGFLQLLWNMYYPTLGTILLLTASCANAHSWVEQLAIIAPNGSYIPCFGYPRAFVDKFAAENFNQEANKWLLPPVGGPPFINETHLLCHPSQQVPIQADSFSRLHTKAESIIALRYAENGHVTMSGGGLNLVGKPEKGGTAFVFSTKQPRPDETLENVMHWTRDGNGGDRSGKLLTAQNFDDDRCYQLSDDSVVLGKARRLQTPNPMPGQPSSRHELSCETEVRIPNDVAVGQLYTLYWVWQWPTARQQNPKPLDGKDEYYTSCIDVKTVADPPLDQYGTLLKDQDPMTAAVPNFESRTALTVDPLALYSQAGFERPTKTSNVSPVVQQTAATLNHRRSSSLHTSVLGQTV